MIPKDPLETDSREILVGIHKDNKRFHKHSKMPKDSSEIPQV